VQAGEALQRVLLTATADGLAMSFLSQLVEVPDVRDDVQRLIATLRPPRRDGGVGDAVRDGRPPLGHRLLRDRPDDGDETLGMQDAPERDRTRQHGGQRTVPAVPDDEQVRRTGLLDEDLCRAPRDRVHLHRDRRERGPSGDHRVDHRPRLLPEVRLEFRGHPLRRHSPGSRPVLE